jgi:hypothetical protein
MDMIPRTAHEWLTDLHVDTNPKNGYIVHSPKGIYGKKIKELVQYFSSQSVELKAIRHSRCFKPNVFTTYLFHIFQFLSEYVLPICIAVYISYVYYTWDSNASLQVPLMTDTSVIPTSTSWYESIPSPTEAGKWIGSNIRSIVSVPVSFIAHIVDRGLHIQEAVETVQTTGSKLVITPMLFLGVYVITKLLCRVILHLRSLCISQRRVWNLQEFIIQETEEALERAITDIVRPFLIVNYEEMLVRTSTPSEIVPKNQGTVALIQLYKENLPLLRTNLMERITSTVKQVPFAELVKRGGLSSLYNTTLHQLIRHADDELSKAMFTYHEDIHKASIVQSNIIDTGKYAIQGAIQGATYAMVRGDISPLLRWAPSNEIYKTRFVSLT